MNLRIVHGRRIAACLALGLPCGWAPAAAAAEWKPDKRVEIVVTTGAGGGNDRIARLAHKIMVERKFVDAVATVVNKPGGGQVLGLTYLNQHA